MSIASQLDSVRRELNKACAYSEYLAVARLKKKLRTTLVTNMERPGLVRAMEIVNHEMEVLEARAGV